jgi:O-antigen/teichoic acid export membrane protein
MSGVRRAFIWASVGQYVLFPVNLTSTLIIARLIDPSEFGVSVLGAALIGIAEAVREIGGGTYLIQKKSLDVESVPTTFTVSVIATFVIAASLTLLAGPIARYLHTPGLQQYLDAAILGYMTGPFVYPTMALISRELAFGVLGFITAMTALTNALVGIMLASFGFGYMSLAWASVVSAFVGTGVCLAFSRDVSVFRFSLQEWRDVVRFGLYSSTTAVCFRVGEALPYLIFGRFLNAEAVGFAQRAVLLSLFPERVILAGVGAVALPVFSKYAGTGQSLKEIYLRSIEFITAVQWPALVMLALLAHPIVLTVLGARWGEVVPLVQILSGSLLFSFPIILQYPTLVAVGALKFMPPLIVVQSIGTLAAVSFAGPFGLRPAAATMFLVVPFNAILSLLLLRRYLGFQWIELAAALRKSAFAVVATAIGPVTVVACSGWRTDLTLGAAVVAAFLSGPGWLLGLWLSRHPLLTDMLRAYEAFLRIPPIHVAVAYCKRSLGMHSKRVPPS